MTIAKPKTTRTRRTKAEIQEEFDLIAQEAAKAAESSNPKIEGIVREKEEAMRDAVKEMTADGVVRKLTELSLEITKALSVISEKMVIEVQQLSTLRQAVFLETSELERLHKIDVALMATDDLVEEYAQKRHKLEAEMAALEEELKERQELRASENKEYEELLKKARQREVEDYEYKKLLERKKAQDKYEDEIRQRTKENLEKQDQLEKGWAQRELVIKAQEDEILSLKKQVGDFPAKLKLEVDRAIAETIREINLQKSQELSTLQHNIETEKRLAELRTRTLEETINRYILQVQTLEIQTTEAKKQVQEIAVKAIEGASGAKALSHVNQIAIEQAKLRSP